MARSCVTPSRHLVRGKAKDELVVRVGAEGAPLGGHGEGRLPVGVAFDPVRAVGLSGHQGLQVGQHDLPVEGQLHVPVRAWTAGPRSGPSSVRNRSSRPCLAWSPSARSASGPARGGARGRGSTGSGSPSWRPPKRAPSPRRQQLEVRAPGTREMAHTGSHAPTIALQGSGRPQISGKCLQCLPPHETCHIDPHPAPHLSSYGLPGPLWPERYVPTGCQERDNSMAVGGAGLRVLLMAAVSGRAAAG